MTIESLPSKNVAILDVPEVESLTAEFQYFYWTADEFENGLGSSQASFKQIPSETFDANYVSLTRKLPRLIKLNWKPVTLNRTVTKPGNPILIRDFFEKLHSEETFTSNDFTTLRYQDNGADLRLKFFMDKFASLLPDLENANSADEVVELLNNRTSEQVSVRFFAEVISDLSRQGVTYSSPSQTSSDILQRLKNVALHTRLNNRLLVPIANTVKEDSVGVFSDEFSSENFSKMIESIQNTAISNANSNLLSPLDYEFEVLAYVGYRPVDTNGYDPFVESLGYIIEKRETRSDGSEELHPPIIIESPFVGTTYDGQIRYNSVYYYKMRAVYLVEVRAVDETTKQNLLVSFLVGSKFTPPPAPPPPPEAPPPPELENADEKLEAKELENTPAEKEDMLPEPILELEFIPEPVPYQDGGLMTTPSKACPHFFSTPKIIA
jgi:hypothetical protein